MASSSPTNTSVSTVNQSGEQKSPPGTDRPLNPPASPKGGEVVSDAPKARPNHWREDRSNWISYWLLLWLNPILHLGYQRPLEDADLPDVRDDLRAELLLRKFKQNWMKEVDIYKENKKQDEAKKEMENAKTFVDLNVAADINGTRSDVLEDKDPKKRKRKPQQLKQPKRPTPSLGRALNRSFGLRYWGAAIFKMGSDACSLATPILLSNLLTFLAQITSPNIPDDQKPSVETGYLYSMGMFLLACGSTLCMNEMQRSSNATGIRVRSALVTAIYEKSLRLSPGARARLNTGQIVSMMSIDCTKIDLSLQFFHMGWTAIFTLAVAVALIARALGSSAAVAVGCIFIGIPIQIAMMRFISRARVRAASKTDIRMKVMTEILQGIRVIKLYAWETPFLKRLFDIRQQEMNAISMGLYSRAMNNTINMFVPALMMCCTYITYSYTNSIHDASAVFSAMVLLNLLRWPLVMFPFAISATADARVCLARIQMFLLAEELSDGPKLLPPVEKSKEGTFEDFAIRIVDGEFSWATPPQGADARAGAGKDAKGGKGKIAVTGNDKNTNGKGMKGEKSDVEMKSVAVNFNPNTPALLSPSLIQKPSIAPNVASTIRGINFQVQRGQLIGVVGNVGSGKSSLLSGILGDMKRVKGEVQLRGSVAYMSQQAWIQNASLKDNVLFGKAFDSVKYEKAIEVCALNPDISVLPAGDMTEIGERGINLSGGQKQRVSIARSVYHDADIYLFDDPLSAVDAHVSKHIFNECIQKALKHKTRVLVTHQLQYMPECDLILFMESGVILERGKYSQLMEMNGKFAELMRNYGGRDSEDEDKKKETDAPLLAGKSMKGKKFAGMSIANGEAAGGAKKKPVNKNNLMSSEERTRGGLKFATITFFIGACGGYWALLLFILFYCCLIVSNLWANNWLQIWVQSTYGLEHGVYAAIYGAMAVAQFLSGFIAMRYVANRALRAARFLHDHAFRNVMRAPMSFFDTTPIGRVMNRFSRDQDTIDNQVLSESIRMAAYMFLNAIGSLAMIGVYNYYFFIVLPFIFFFYSMIQAYYRASSRELKRLDAIARSPLFAHFSETLSGLPTIRAYQRQDMFLAENFARVDANNRPYYLLQLAARWLAERLEFLGAAVILTTGVLGVAARASLNPSTLGLSLSYAVMMTQVLSMMVRQLVESENNMNAVERSKFYADAIAQEKPAHMPADDQIEKRGEEKGEKWPHAGEVVFQKLSMRYRPGLPLVLKEVSLKIHGGERIGIVGRTGAGKSSLMLALFRLIEADSGSVAIDGVDISKIGLEYLRSHLAIIPQDPVLYSGTVRSNLDPFNLYEDKQLWNVLEKVYLKDAVTALPLKLESTVTENGENFSMGQRCQMNLARAILRDAKILVMDEATASIDLETDALIQASVRKDFQCTILTIAHRLNTIIDYDRVVVMANGTVVEDDIPHILLQKPNSYLSQLVDETGEANAALLRSIAESAYKSLMEQRTATRSRGLTAHANIEVPLLTMTRAISNSVDKTPKGLHRSVSRELQPPSTTSSKALRVILEGDTAANGALHSTKSADAERDIHDFAIDRSVSQSMSAITFHGAPIDEERYKRAISPHEEFDEEDEDEGDD